MHRARLALWILVGLCWIALPAASSAEDAGEEAVPGDPTEPASQAEPAVATEADPAPDGQAASAPAVRLSRLQGTAYLDRRTKVVGASVIVHPELNPSRIYLTSTDEKGTFRLDRMPDGSYQVQVRRDGLEPVTKDSVALKFPFRAVVEVAMHPSEVLRPGAPVGEPSSDLAELRGTIVGQDGEPVSEVEVRLVRSDGRADPMSVQSDSTGRFEFGDLPSGGWRLSALGLGYLPIQADLDLQDETELTLIVVEQPANYEPSPLELLPPERLIPPAEITTGTAEGQGSS